MQSEYGQLWPSMHNTQQDTVGEPEIRFNGMGGGTARLTKSPPPSYSLLTLFWLSPFSCLQTRRRRANVINSQMELSLLSDGLVKPFPEEEVRGLGGRGR